jgi:hypothetical protein
MGDPWVDAKTIAWSGADLTHGLTTHGLTGNCTHVERAPADQAQERERRSNGQTASPPSNDLDSWCATKMWTPCTAREQNLIPESAASPCWAERGGTLSVPTSPSVA